MGEGQEIKGMYYSIAGFKLLHGEGIKKRAVTSDGV